MKFDVKTAQVNRQTQQPTTVPTSADMENRSSDFGTGEIGTTDTSSHNIRRPRSPVFCESTPQSSDHQPSEESSSDYCGSANMLDFEHAKDSSFWHISRDSEGVNLYLRLGAVGKFEKDYGILCGFKQSLLSKIVITQ